jgi:hypothetical protein
MGRTSTRPTVTVRLRSGGFKSFDRLPPARAVPSLHGRLAGIDQLFALFVRSEAGFSPAGATVVHTGVFVVGLVGFWPVMTASLMESLARECLGGDHGFSRAVFYSAVGSLGPAHTGVVVRRLSYATAYGGLVDLPPLERRRDPRAEAVRVTGGSKRC